MRKKLLFFAIIGIAAIGAVFFNRGTIRTFWFAWNQPTLPPSVLFASTPAGQEVSPETEKKVEVQDSEVVSLVPEKLKESEKPATAINLAVPFTSQAPYGNWDAVHEEACEEASLLMVDAFFDGRSLAPDTVEAELQELVAWQKNRFGYFESTTAEETALVMREYYGYRKVEVSYDITLEDIRRVVAFGLPVVVPLYGVGLNPNYTGNGPNYHMLVVRGFTADGKIITNDPGTRLGQGYVYDPQKFYNAIHDWNGGDVINGKKAMIVAYPNQ
ncbi:MAG: C39 family peptidase [bacterium]|nr:C39 family peptidase [bacterium]